ncbi:RHS repeat-associated core domain-containing protein [Plantactinospora sp. KLBMP9567]|uniref:RHS repeat-associated core domain-containing protein n=1 Tax=Plantactinospora sp. KLBMP9567 TaxID=3085900 RepID=UPI002981CF3C|nr:RHS repeat-associated core domain-containing protein [Plantactinospora sp. KLBMP9567]MDW5328921.1 RHS repeat-associated core domain-containing protein [Plantactinospora sp. KLBMP9567]MDW5328928.1 RHS repeat-associated core domain-containing protein [Plantactinospora sp. KLBMP9567]
MFDRLVRGRGFRVRRRGATGVAYSMAVVLAVTLPAGIPAPAGAGPEAGPRLSVTQPRPVRSAPVPARPRPADLSQGAAERPVTSAAWPAAGVAEASAGVVDGRAAARGDASAASGSRAGSLPVSIGPPLTVAPVSGADGPATSSVRSRVDRARVEVLDRSVVPAAWRDGIVLRVARADAASAGGRVNVTVDYSGFAGVFGSDWSTRLRLVALPACALTTPGRPECLGTALPSRNDAGARRVSADVDLPAARHAAARGGGAGVLIAVRAAPSGETGDYAATPLLASSTWVASPSSGTFTWSYPVEVPPAPGLTPDITLSYASSVVDGRSDASNNQPSWLGEGFEYHPGFIERRYVPCASDMAGAATNKTETGDLCWGTDNAVLSLSGRSVELIRDSATGAWRSRSDDASRVERLTGASNGDGDGEYWKVTTDDGTQYFFGRHALPGHGSVTNSTNHVRVYGNHSGEPCYNSSFASGHCDQAWRWNLDYVVDTHGNTMSLWYVRETNRYGANLQPASPVSYVRSSTLTRIDYGTWDRGAADRSVTPTAQVIFSTADRCVSDCSEHDEAHWPDVPWDQECAGPDCADKVSPTFWSTKRLAKISTRVAGTSGDVDSWTLTQTFPPNGDASRDGMWLESIVHAGHVGGTVTLPEINFDWVQRPNRVDALGDTKPPMYWMRLGTIWTESGGKISAIYSDPQCAKGGPMPASPQTNTLRCFPVLSEDTFTRKTETEYFHKYVVTGVLESDWTGGGTDVVTAYEYLDGAAWRYTDDDGLTQDRFRTWADYRGYQRVRIRKGTDGRETLTETRYYRGTHGDKAAPSGGTRSVRLPAVDLTGNSDTTDPGDAPEVTDEDALAGAIRQETVYNGIDSDIVSTRVDQAWQSAPTATRRIGDTAVHARYTGTGVSWDATRLDAGRGWRVTKRNTAFDSYGMVTSVTDHGDVAVADDQQCEDTTYARNTATNLLSLPARVQTLAIACGQTPTSPDDVISDVRTAYDGGAHGAAPTRGDATRVEELKDWTTAGGTTWLTTATSSYDTHGRVVAATDVRGNRTTTAYTPAAGGPVTRTVTTNHLGWTTTEDLSPARGVPTRTTDENGKVTDLRYDGLGQLTAVWLPNRPKASNEASPSIRYAYRIRNSGGVSAVTAETMNAEGNYLTTNTLYDGLLRERQTQRAADSGGGTVVTERVYDAAGRIAYTVANHHDPNRTPGTTLVTIAQWQANNQTVNHYDRAGRITEEVVTSGGTARWRTRTGHGGDRTYVTPPAGGTPTTTITDARGNTVEVRQHAGGSVGGSYDTTRFIHDRRNQLVAAIDPAGNRWTYGYDTRGRQIRVDDPDKGETTSTYNDYGDLVTVTDAEGRKLVHEYDQLGRQTGRYRTSINPANKLASWAYDPSGANGRLASSSRWTNSGTTEYQVRVRGYTALYQPTGEDYIIPATETGLAGTYSFTQTYKADGTSLATTTYPSAGGLGGEQLTHTYDPVTGLPEQLRTNWPGAGHYVTDTGWTAFGELGLIQFQQTAQSWLQRSFAYDDTTRRLRTASTLRQLNPQWVADLHHYYDDVGNITKIADTPAGNTTDTQCFEYDYQRRLTNAWTPDSGDCVPTPTVIGLGGPAPYWHSWTFDPVGRSTGNRITETRHGATDTVSTYSYPAPGGDRPHGLTQVVTTGAGNGIRTLAFDASGNATCRPMIGVATNACPGGAGSQDLDWDSEGRLATVHAGTDQHSYLYDADGDRLIARDPAGATLYLPGMEIRHTSGGTTTVARYYTYGGQMAAMRMPGRGITWLVDDHQGTQQIAVVAGDQTVIRRRQTPYGEPRGAATNWPNPKGFVSGDRDPTGLTHLGAREYDPAIGMFLSADPVHDLADPQQWNAYSYATNSPVTLSDADGLRPLITNTGQGDAEHYRKTGERVVKKSNGKWVVNEKRSIKKTATSARDQLAKWVEEKGIGKAAGRIAEALEFVGTLADYAVSFGKLVSAAGRAMRNGATKGVRSLASFLLRMVKNEKGLRIISKVGRSPITKTFARVTIVAGGALETAMNLLEGDDLATAVGKGLVVAGASTLGATLGAAAGSLCGKGAVVCSPLFGSVGAGIGGWLGEEMVDGPLEKWNVWRRTDDLVDWD